MALSELVDDRASASTAPNSPYLAGLDGLRALAVVAVLLYHAGYHVAGGYLGVELFFVLCGFLITTLLVADQRRHGRIRLGTFWLRRARRLLPALIVTLVGPLILSVVLLPGELRPLGADTLVALLYVMNWKLIIAQQPYFDALSRPSLIQHLWSLAIEEQFYLLWPLACAAGMRLLRPGGFRAAVLAAALASSLLMAALYDTGADISRIYYGTDTRASALLIGAALALIWTHDRRQLLDRRRDAALETAGVLARARDEPIATWLPDNNVPSGKRITVRQLLQHTTGLYDYLEDRKLIGEMQRDTRYEWQPQELVDYASRFAQRAIGRWDYSSTNYVVLGMLAERVTGQPLAQQVRQRIFDPLGMCHAAFLPQEPVPDMLAHGYSYENDVTRSSMSFAFTTANLAMTTSDLERFGRALFSKELLRAETRDIMLGKFVI